MTNPELFHAMTDDQLAEWARLSASVHRLTADLAEARAGIDAVLLTARSEGNKLRAVIEQCRTTIADLTTKHAEQMSNARRTAAQLVVVLGALDALVKLILDDRMWRERQQWPGELYRAIDDAKEVLRLNGFPF